MSRFFSNSQLGGWSGGAKVSCTSRHWGVQLILAYSWARPAILVAGKGRRGMFLFLLFLHFHSCSSFFPVLSFISSTISSISFLPFSGRRHKMTHKGWRVVKPQHNQSLAIHTFFFSKYCFTSIYFIKCLFGCLLCSAWSDFRSSLI